MLVLVTYDVNTQTSEGRKRLRKVAKICVSKGQRVQNSVLECSLNMEEYTIMKHQLEQTIDKSIDSIRFYNLGNNYNNRIEHIGAKDAYDPEGLLMY